MEVKTEICVNLTEGSFKIEGSEKFVLEQLSTLKEYIADTRFTEPRQLRSDNLITTDSICETSNVSPTFNQELLKYTSIVHVDDDGEVSILQKIPGKSKSERMKRIALIVLFAKNEKIIAKTLIPICEKHSCYDGGNFSTAFSNDITNFIKKGKGKMWTLELTMPGRESAVALLDEMVNSNVK